MSDFIVLLGPFGLHLYEFEIGKLAYFRFKFYLKSDPGVGVFLQILENFQKHFFHSSDGGYFCVNRKFI